MAERMTGIDAAWLHMDRPTNTADVVSLMTFDDRVPPRAVRRLLEDKLLHHRRFQQRIVPEGPLGLAAWADDPAFSLGRHVTRTTLPRGGTRALQTFTSQVASERLDPAHPLWHVHHVDGFGAGSALVVKLHHCMADGFALVGVLLSLADELPPALSAAAVTPAAVTPAAKGGTFRDLRLDGDVTRALWKALVDPSRALDLASRGASFARSLAAMAILPPDPPTSLHRALSGRRRIAFSPPIPLAPLRERARALKVTVNDLLTAALAGALREELLAAGDPVATDIRALTMPGGYVTGVLESQPSARIRLSGPGLRTYVSFEWELNHGDSRQHMGEVSVGARF